MHLLTLLVCSSVCVAHALRKAQHLQILVADAESVSAEASSVQKFSPVHAAATQAALWSPHVLDSPYNPDDANVNRIHAALRPRGGATRLAAMLYDEAADRKGTNRTLELELAELLPDIWADRVCNLRKSRPDDRRDQGEAVLADVTIDPSFTVLVKVQRSDSEQTHREYSAAYRLALFREAGDIKANNIIQYYKVGEQGGRTFFMMEAAERNLEELVGLLQFPGQKDHASRVRQLLKANRNPSKARGEMLAPTFTIPILIDLLRGCMDLEQAGLLHGELSMENVLVLGGRAVIGGLGAVCTQRTGSDGGAGYRDLRDSRGQRVGTVFVQAPEMVDSVPTGPKSHVWSLGLIFARMSLGLDPIHHCIFAYAAAPPKALDFSLEDRESVREMVREGFDIDFVPGFDSLHPEIRRLLMGMLQKDPRDRWSTSITLEQAEKAAVALAAKVPPQRVCREFPQGAFGNQLGDDVGAELLEDSWQ